MRTSALSDLLTQNAKRTEKAGAASPVYKATNERTPSTNITKMYIQVPEFERDWAVKTASPS